jgi:hypothetical protein
MKQLMVGMLIDLATTTEALIANAASTSGVSGRPYPVSIVDALGR